MDASSSISAMVSQSRTVLTSPSVATFERFESQGTLKDALLYVALAAAVTGVFGLSEGLAGFVRNILVTLIGFFVFSYLVHLFGKQRGGTGTLDEVAYTFALFWAPLSVLFGVVTLVLAITIVGLVLVPLVALIALALNIYFGYLAVQSSMNLEGGGSTWGVLLLAALGSFLINVVLSALLS